MRLPIGTFTSRVSSTQIHLLAACLAILLTIGCGDSQPNGSGSNSNADNQSGKVLKFSAIPDQDTTELKEKFDALAEHLSNELGVSVENVPSTDYKASVEAFKSGDIQLAWFGGLTGVQARHAVAGAEAIVQGKSDPTFKSYFIVHKDSPLQKSNEFPMGLADHSFSFGSPSSTSGRLMPEHFLRVNTKKSPDEFFKTAPSFSGSHDKTVELVETGQVQSGAVNFKVYDKRVAEGKTDPETCRIVWVTPDYADYNFTAHPDLETMFGEGFTKKLQDTLIAVDDPALLSAFPREALIQAKSEDFDGIKKVAVDLGFIRE